MASSSFALHVSSAQRSSISPKLVDLKILLSSTLKPFVKNFLHIPLEVNVSRTIKEASRQMLDFLVDSVFQFVDQPYLSSQSNFVPVEEIGHVMMIENIEGIIPTDYPAGVYLRIGPNPLFGGLKSAVSVFGQSSHSWIEGEGMLHAMYFTKDSQGYWAVLYNNRYVETETFLQEKRKNKPSFLPAIEGDSPAILAAYLLNLIRFGKVNKYISNTNIFEHSGNLYTIAENHLPQEIDICTLQTIGRDWDVGGSWDRPFTSHPKKAPGTGELVTVGVDAMKPYVVLGVISADGKNLLHKVDLKFERCTICHDIGITQNYNIIMDCPITIGIDRLIEGGPLIKYDKEDYARIGVMPRYGDANSIKWFEVESHCTFHILNCFEDGDEVVVRGCRALGSIIPGPDFGHDKFEWFSRGFKITNAYEGNANMQEGQFFSCTYEWRLNMETGEVKERNLTGTSCSMDFPMINESYTGLRNKYGYTQVVDSVASSNSGMAKYGMLAKLYFEEIASTPSELKENFDSEEEVMKIEYHKFEENNFCSGAAFVPKHGGLDEDDGWIVCFVHDEVSNISQVHIADTKRFEDEPVAKITLPHRVPYGFHGAYFPTPLQKQQVLSP